MNTFETQLVVLMKGYLVWGRGDTSEKKGWRPLLYKIEHGCHRRKQKEEEKWYFRIPPRESSPLLYPLWTDSSEGPSTADGHLSHSRARERKKVKGLTSYS